MLAILFLDKLDDLIVKYRKYRQCRKAINELRSLSDYELRDIGISRSDISRLAVCNYK